MESELVIQTATEAGDVAIGTHVRRRRFKHYRLLSRLGISYQDGGLSVGVSATTPSASISGTGISVFDAAATSSENSGTIVQTPVLAASVQDDLTADFKSRWAVGAGLGWTIRGTQIHTSTEWFQGVERFTALEAQPVIPQTGTGEWINDLTVEYRSILNWGIGVEQDVGEARLFASIASDHSAAPLDAPDRTDVSLTHYDLMRFGAGAPFRLGRADLMLGIGWASGTSPFKQVFNITRLDLDFDVDDLPETDLRLTEWSAVIGFEWRPAGNGSGDGSYILPPPPTHAPKDS